MVAISNINSFSNCNTFTNKDELGLQPKQNKAKRLAIAASSLTLSGLGQIINNENSKGFMLMAADILSYITFKIAQKTSKVAAFFPWLVNVAIKCWAAVDAYKKAE